MLWPTELRDRIVSPVYLNRMTNWHNVKGDDVSLIRSVQAESHCSVRAVPVAGLKRPRLTVPVILETAKWIHAKETFPAER